MSKMANEIAIETDGAAVHRILWKSTWKIDWMSTQFTWSQSGERSVKNWVDRRFPAGREFVGTMSLDTATTRSLV